MSDLLHALTFAAALNTGVAAGLFFAFSTGVMPGLALLPPGEGGDAMRAINRAVPNPVFMLGFLGPALLGLVVGVWWLADRNESPLLITGALLYLAGAVAVTGRFNIPRNDALAKTGPDDEAYWNRYLVEWTRWNHVRFFASLASAGCYVAAL
ncbi:DUF1772 domain-containing protein [Actinocorallia longicatena]|uniref:DUF1772 domain-containing protein n=1 Tax=Actinocorallia longicatena TaxID=111803 RepID=A0ABP6PW74_9ACTN